MVNMNSIAYLVAWEDLSSKESEGMCVKKGTLQDALDYNYDWSDENRPTWLHLSEPRIIISDENYLKNFLEGKTKKYIKRFENFIYKTPTEEELMRIYINLAPEFISISPGNLQYRVLPMFTEPKVFRFLK